MWTNPGEIPGNGIDDDGNGYIDDVYGINAITGSGNPNDDNHHGTHRATEPPQNHLTAPLPEASGFPIVRA